MTINLEREYEQKVVNLKNNNTPIQYMNVGQNVFPPNDNDGLDLLANNYKTKQ